MHWLSRVRPVELAEVLKRLLRISYAEFTIGPRRFWLDPVSDFGQRLLSEGGYEAHATDVLMQQLEPGDTFVDVGANEGWFSVCAAERVGPAGRVIVIEPQARLWPVIAANFRLNDHDNYSLVPAAAGSALGTTELILYPSLNTGASSLIAERRTRARSRQQVGVMTLARICDVHRLQRIRLAKIDVEGFELEVLKGAGDWLGRIERIFLEIHPPQLAALGQLPADVERLLQSRGYRLEEVDGVHLWILK